MNNIDYRISYLNRLADFGYLHYPHDPYDLAVIHDGKRVVVKPIIEVLPGTCFFNFKQQSYFLRDFRHTDPHQEPPDWALDWLRDRIAKKPYKVDTRMSHIDRFMLDGAIKRRQLGLVERLNQF